MIFQADPGEDRVPARTEAGFPTPPPTPKKLLPNGKAVVSNYYTEPGQTKTYKMN